MSGTFCPASMCPLFAPNGSPWTGEKDSECPQDFNKCRWWQGFGGEGCDGCTAAVSQITDAAFGRPVLQIGPVRAKRGFAAPKFFDCPRAAECQWQRESGEKLCPPRLALSLGLDPKIVAY